QLRSRCLRLPIADSRTHFRGSAAFRSALKTDCRIFVDKNRKFSTRIAVILADDDVAAHALDLHGFGERRSIFEDDGAADGNGTARFAGKIAGAIGGGLRGNLGANLTCAESSSGETHYGECKTAVRMTHRNAPARPGGKRQQRRLRHTDCDSSWFGTLLEKWAVQMGEGVLKRHPRRKSGARLLPLL